MRSVELPLVLVAFILFPTQTRAQQDQNTKANALRGCWKLEVGAFQVSESTHVDRGQTTLPQFIQLDTVAGRSFFGKPLGRLVRALPWTADTDYRDGYYTFPHPDSVHIDWTNGFVGVTLAFPFDTLVMRGRAEAWTDYGGDERAPVTVRRSPCPT
jgi:hypothetical protein